MATFGGQHEVNKRIIHYLTHSFLHHHCTSTSLPPPITLSPSPSSSPCPFGTVTMSSPSTNTALASSGRVDSGKRNLHISSSSWSSESSTEPPSLTTIFVTPGWISIVCALTSPIPSVSATKRKQSGSSSTTTSASERNGSSRTQLNTCGSRRSFLLPAIPNSACASDMGFPPSTPNWIEMLRFRGTGWTFMMLFLLLWNAAEDCNTKINTAMMTMKIRDTFCIIKERLFASSFPLPPFFFGRRR